MVSMAPLTDGFEYMLVYLAICPLVYKKTVKNVAVGTLLKKQLEPKVQ